MAKILIGISGSIAAYKSLELVHKLSQLGHEVKVILTCDAQRFVTKIAFLALGAEVYTDDYGETKSEVMQHISLAKWPDLTVIMPLSANTLSKIACGLADNLLTATILATSSKVFLVPAMNMQMWGNGIIQDNIRKLKSYNYKFWGPTSGLQACGDNGDGRMIEPNEVLIKIKHMLLATNNQKLNGLKVVITAGATRELIDPVRYISNHSSGKMGVALANAMSSYGADVFLIAGVMNTDLPTTLPHIERVTSAKQMLEASLIHAIDADIFIGCAAVVDYVPTEYQLQKIKKTDDAQLKNLPLTVAPDIIATIKLKYPQLFVVGFAAESTNLIDYAKTKLQTKKLDLIVANDISSGDIFGTEENAVTLIDRKLNITHVARAHKDIIAHEVLSAIGVLYQTSIN